MNRRAANLQISDLHLLLTLAELPVCDTHGCEHRRPHGLGRQYELQKRIHASDSVSKALFQTALKLAKNRDLLGEGDESLAQARLAFADEIVDAVRRADVIVALAAGRRARLLT